MLNTICSSWRHWPRWLLGGLLYGFLEIAYRGYTHWTMMLLAALLCVPLDIANEHMPWHLPLVCQGVLGGLVITAAELVAGLLLNCWLGLGIWDYSGIWGNLWGQICPQFALLWCILAVPAIIIFDWWDYLFGCGDWPHYQII